MYNTTLRIKMSTTKLKTRIFYYKAKYILSSLKAKYGQACDLSV